MGPALQPEIVELLANGWYFSHLDRTLVHRETLAVITERELSRLSKSLPALARRRVAEAIAREVD